MKPIIAIVGRANVGKSTLFNRLIKQPIAIVEDLPGTTRDRIFADATLNDIEVTLVDTGGLGLEVNSKIEHKVKSQVLRAIEEADLVLFMLDVRDGLIATDREIGDLLRKSNKPVIVVANKADNPSLENQIIDFYELGLGNPIAISAHHKRNIQKLIDMITSSLPSYAHKSEDETGEYPKLAIVGRPNVGKSMLLNALTGTERAIVDSTPGTTRDAIDTIYDYRGQNLLLIDTAGIRRRGKSGTGIDYYSLLRSLRAIDRCDIALLVMDATEFMTAQDMHIAGYIKDAFKGMVLVINKCDLITREVQEEMEKEASSQLRFMPYVPVISVSALKNKNTNKIFPAVMEIWAERQKKLPDEVVNKMVKRAVESLTPPPKGLKRLEIYKTFQESVNPPTFVFLVNDPDLLHFSYERYLENRFRELFGFRGTPLRFIFKKLPKKGKIKAIRGKT